ncbi:MAG: peptidylprolyl isomerase [Peptococcaceae bacterium]|jgi:peptidyl-prolyl cis-trans isomerase B (cyclophilin B)|nr:peptidylprolyl isomerase [Peptococcaceae bacterium]
MSSESNPAMSDKPDIVVELDPSVAPNTVLNFISLASRGYYDGLCFHRIIPGFMIQGGCPYGSGMGGPGYSIRGEFSGNGFDNPLKHDRGVISMARSQNPNSAGSQFFIMVDDAPFLDGQYAAFGQVVSGMETADAIVATPRNDSDRPLADIVIESMTVDTFGVEYAQPETR